MSIYSSNLGGQCSGPNQSPINLSQSFAKPCDLLCELVFDDATIQEANVIVSDEGLVLQSTSGLGTCKFNGEGYTCNSLLVTHPSHHTIENIQADGEVVAVFTNPSGKLLSVSSLFRVNPAQTPSSQFFNAFVPYANSATPYTSISLGGDWSLSNMVPPAGAYFVYEGSLVFPPCSTSTWVVFKSMINIDSNNFALLAKNVSPGSRGIQPLGNRDVFFNDIENLPGGPMPHDNKLYMRIKRLPKKKGDVKEVTKPDIRGKKESSVSGISKWASDQYKKNGFIALVDVVLLICSFVLGIYYGYAYAKTSMTGLYFVYKAQDFAKWIRSWFSKPTQ